MMDCCLASCCQVWSPSASVWRTDTRSLGDIFWVKDRYSFEELSARFNLGVFSFLLAAQNSHEKLLFGSLADTTCWAVTFLCGFVRSSGYSSILQETHVLILSRTLDLILIGTRSSRNPFLRHFESIHRTYRTPRWLHCMKLKFDPNCTLCLSACLIWECPSVSFWRPVKENKLTVLIWRQSVLPSRDVPCCLSGTVCGT